MNGGILQNTKFVYKLDNRKTFVIDSSLNNIGKFLPRKYYGADLQLKLKNDKGFTELRAEFITGTQTSFSNTTETPAALPTDNLIPFYIREFNGAYFYLLHNIINTKHQLGIKYDWYDPNRNVKENEIGTPGSNINEANIKYSTLGFGYIHYINDNLKFLFWYDKVVNEKTQIPGFTSDVKDNIFTGRLQFRF